MLRGDPPPRDRREAARFHDAGVLIGGMMWAIGHTPHPVNVAAGDSANITFIAADKSQMLTLHSELAARFVYEDVAGKTF